MRVSSVEKQVHLDCFNYAKNKEKPLIEVGHYENGTVHQITTKSNTIIVVLSGALNFHLFQISGNQIATGQLIILPTKSNFKFETTKDTILVIFHLDINLNFCDHFSFEALNKVKKRHKRIHILSCNSVIMSYLVLLSSILSDGLHCSYLMEIKIKEFLYLLRYYYCVEELRVFFSQILNNDFKFSRLVWQNYDTHLSVYDLAKKTNYSISGFEKRFKKAFDMSPSEWMNFQKAQAIHHEIKCSQKTFAELSYEFGFSSPSHFNSFCKKIFGRTPGNIRNQQDKKDNF